jgi:type I restriction enzyme S subunit
MSWENVKLGGLINVLSGYAFDSKHFTLDVGKPLIRIRDIKRSFTETYFNSDYDNKFLIKKGDVLIGMDGEFNISEWKGKDALLNQRVCKVSVKDTNQLDLRYLLHYLPFQLKLIEEKTSFVTVKHLSVKDIQNILIPLPPLETQKRIADILDAADALRQKDQELLKKYDELAQAIFIDMFGDPVKNEKGWEKFTGKELMEVLGGAAFSSTDYCIEGIPLIRIGTINKGYFDSTQLVYLPESFEEKFKKYIIFPKDLLISLTGTAGKDDYGNVYEMEQVINQGLLNQRVAKLIINKNRINSRYLTYYLKQKDVKAELTGISRGVRQGNISNSDIYNLNIMLPPLVLQNKFDQNINSILSLKETQYSSNVKSQALFSSILIKAFNGELVA